MTAHFRRLLEIAVVLAAFLSSASAENLRIVTRNSEPFSFEKDGRRVGFAIELRDSVARELTPICDPCPGTLASSRQSFPASTTHEIIHK
jgi:hypothetical protein